MKRRACGLACVLGLVASPLAAQTDTGPSVQRVVVGPNVNMVGGPASFDPTRDPALVGDPFLQRQNEPSLAPSSRNPCHLLAGSNDYRAVDLEEALELETADAWLGVFKSFDCGATWTSALFPGHPADFSTSGLASPLRGLEAAADATVRAGTSGMFYYSGIAFDRVTSGAGKVFVARFIDNNNADGGDSIKYLSTAVIDTGNSGQFLDKPWIAVDIPRAGAGTCTVDGQTFAAGNVYLAYSAFLGEGNNQHTKILFSKSTNCGATWSNTSKLSERFARNQGTTIAVDPGTGAIYVAWREFTDPDDAGSQHAVLVVKSTDGGKSWTSAERIRPPHPVTGVPYSLQPFDQIPTPTTFRTLMFPTMAIVPSEADGRAAGQAGRVYIAWAARGFVPLGPGQTLGDARIVMTSSVDGENWSYPEPADDYPGAGHQIIPALSFAGGRLGLAFYDLRGNAAGVHEDYVVEYGQQYWQACTDYAAGFGNLWYPAYISCVITNKTAPRRHTLDLRAAMADTTCLSAGTCEFSTYSVSGGFAVDSAQVSQYIGGYSTAQGRRVQLQYNRPNLPLFRKGTYPFIGDYIDIEGTKFLPDGSGGWMWNTGFTPGRPAPVFHVAWGDNRDVKRPGDLNWENFTPVVPGPQGPVCEAGQGGIRNQNVYAAQLRPGLVVTAPLNSKKISTLQRSFVVVARNATTETRTYRLIAQPPDGLVASFDQFLGFGTGAPVTEISAVIPPRSSISRTLFVGLPAGGQTADSFVPVSVEEVVACLPGATCEDPASDVVFLNPDFDSPDFDSPDFDSQELHAPDFDSPDFDTPDFDTPDFDSFTLTTSIRTPDFDSPDFDSPDFDSPDFDSPDFDSPDFDSGVFKNPDFDSPDFDSPDFDSATVGDLTWPVYNTGNTTSAYKANLSLNVPSDPNVRYQLVVRRLYASPIAACIAGGASAELGAQNQVLVNIVDPDISSAIRDRSFNDADRTNATFYLAPGEQARVTLRAYCRAGAPCPFATAADAAESVALGVMAQAANCVVCEGSECSGADNVGGGSECLIDDRQDIYDPIPPVVLGPAPAPIASDDDNSGDESVSFAITASDNVATASVVCTADGTVIGPAASAGDTYSFTGTFPVGDTEVTCTAFDVAPLPRRPGDPPKEPNAASVSFVVTVADVTPPAFDAGGDPGAPFTPGNPAEATGPAGAQVFYTNPTATDSNGGAVTVDCQSASGLQSGNVFPIGATPINCVATDESGVSTPPTNLFDIFVADTTPPVVAVTGAPAAGVEAAGSNGTAVAFSTSAADVVSGALAAVCSPESGSTFPLGTTTVTCSATDASGNTGMATFDITVVDTTAPVLSLPGNITGVQAASAAGAAVAYAATAVDVVDTTPSVACAPVSGSTFALGTTNVNCTATDAAGNSSNGAFSVTVVDTVAPVLTLPADITGVEATSAAGATVAYVVTSNDVVDGAPVVACAPASGSTFALGTTTVNCTATDDAGNSSNGAFAVTVVDTVAPVLTLPANITGVQATSAAGAAVAYVATAADVVDGTPSIVCAPGSGSTFALGATMVNCAATDDAGNSSNGAFTVTVVDTVAPVLSLPANITGVQATSAAGAPVAYVASAADVVDATPSVTCVPASGATFALGTTTVNCTATDDTGNSSSGAFTVTVVDTTPPTSITATVTPALLWPPDGRTVNVTVSGQAFDGQSGVARIGWSVLDEYGTHQPSGMALVPGNGPFTFQVPLIASRRGNDKNGRHYTIRLTAYDAAGNAKVLANPPVVNVHDQSGN